MRPLLTRRELWTAILSGAAAGLALCALIWLWLYLGGVFE